MRLTVSSLIFAFALTASLTSGVVRGSGENLLKNGNFEKGLTNWGSLWSRDSGKCAKLELANKTRSANDVHSGSYAAHLNHTCTTDWHFTYSENINVTYEGRYEISYWTRVDGDASFRAGVIAYDETGSVLSWEVTDLNKRGNTNGEWVCITGNIWIALQNASYVAIRFVGTGEGDVYIDDIEFKSFGKKPFFLDFSTGDDDSVEVRMDTQTGLLNVTLPGTDLRWDQIKTWGPTVTELISYDSTSVSMMITDGFKVTISLTKGVPEIVYRISSNGTKELNMFPHPFNSDDGHVIIPLNEGITIPVKSADEIGSQTYSLANGHSGLCMAFW